MNERLFTRLVSPLGILLLPTIASAEVMDKAPTVPSLWTTALVVGLVGFFAWRSHVALGVLVTLVAIPLVGGSTAS